MKSPKGIRPCRLKAAAVYLLIGNRIFPYASSPVYNTALTVFIALYGVVVLIDL